MPSKTWNITSTITASFSGGGYSATLNVGGQGNANIKMKLEWDDNPDDAGDAIDSITILGQTWNSPGENGSDTRTFNITPGNYNVSCSGQIRPFRSIGGNKITFKDKDGNDANAIFTIQNISQKQYSLTVSADLTVSPKSAKGPPNGATCTNLTWNTNGATAVDINGYGKGATGSETRCPNLSSNACGGPSPAVKEWTLTACNGPYCVSDTKKFKLKSDDNPSNSWNTLFSNLEPDTQYTFTLGTIACIDRPANGSASPGSLNKSTYNNGNTVTLTGYSAAFNTSIPSSGNFGSTNDKNFNVSVGQNNFNVTFRTRAPNVKEDFNYGDVKDNLPFPDIDVVPGSPNQYQQTGAITANDIDIPVEIKVSDPNAQVRINNGGWQNVRST